MCVSLVYLVVVWCFALPLCVSCVCLVFFFQAEDGIRDLVRSRGLGDVYKRQAVLHALGWFMARSILREKELADINEISKAPV